MTKHIHLYLFALAFFIGWTLLVVFSGYHAISTEKHKTVEIAKKEAITTFNKDQTFRLWASDHGGVYVPASEDTPPNKYLAHIPDRDITTPLNKKLTLMNPAFMLRQVMEDYSKLYGTKGYITSLNPLNPINRPDEWQRIALEKLENEKLQEVFEITTSSDETYFRLMRPMLTTEGCLKCHGVQGYKIGDLRGGIGVKVAMSQYLSLEKQSIKNIVISHFLFWFFGGTILSFFVIWGKGQILKENISKKQLRLSKKKLEKALEEVKTLRGIIPICSYCKKIRDDEGVWRQLEAYIRSRSEAEFSHGACPDCYKKQMKKIKGQI